MRKSRIILLFSFITVMVVLLSVSVMADEYTPPFGDVSNAFMDYIDERAGEENFAYKQLYDYYLGFGDSRFFTINTLVSGITHIGNNLEYYATIPFSMNVDSGATKISTKIYCDAFSYAIFTQDTVTPQLGGVLQSGYVQLDFYMSDDNTVFGTYLYVAMDGTVLYRANWDGYYEPSTGNLYMDVYGISVSSNFYSSFEIYEYQIAFVPKNNDDCVLLSLVTGFFSDSAPYYYSDKVYSPSTFYDGYSRSYNIGYADGERYGYQYGYDDGYADGVIDGYEQGMQEQVSVEEAFDNGYNTAVLEINSGQFGRNFLGGALSAPFRVLQDIHIIEWTTEGGRTVSISFMTIFVAIFSLSLFIWFMKMFAGG